MTISVNNGGVEVLGKDIMPAPPAQVEEKTTAKQGVRKDITHARL